VICVAAGALGQSDWKSEVPISEGGRRGGRPHLLASLAIDQQAESTWNSRRTLPGSWLREVSSIRKQMVRLAVHAHGFRAHLGVNGFHCAELIWCVLVENMDLACPGGNEK